MLISCEKCSTTYVLDDAVIPAQGAPVQCTRCGHVFTARHAASAPSPELPTKPNTGTLMFAAPSIPPATAAATSRPPGTSAASQTMVFGAVTPQASTPTPTPAPTAAAASKTMVFGGTSAEAPAPAARRPGQPVTFGTPAVNPIRGPAPSAESSSGARSATVLFGGASAPEPGSSPGPSASDAGKQTIVFGGRADATAAPAVADQRSQTMMFGRTSGRATPKVTAAESAPRPGDARGSSESTVRVDLESVAPVAAPVETAKTRHDRTQLYAAVEEPAVAVEAPERHNRTVLFAMNPSDEAAAAEGLGPALDAELASPGPAMANQTLMYAGGAGAREEPEFRGDSELSGDPGFGSSAGGAEPELGFEVPAPEPGLDDHQQLDLPPDSAHGDDLAPAESSEPDAADLAAMRAASNRRTTVAVIAFLVIALLIGLALAWYLFGRALVTGDGTRVEKEVRSILATLRKDDEAAQTAAAEQARLLLQTHPQSVVARSALIIALAFSVDDSNAETARAQGRMAELKRRLAATEADSPRQGPLRAQLDQAEARAGEGSKRSGELEGALRAELDALRASLEERAPSAADRLAALRAQAVAAGVLGEVAALALAEEFRQNASGPDNWAELALPEYVCNGGSSFDEALKQLDAVEARDDTFLRAYVLSARIHLIQHDTAQAESLLARVLAFHPGHDSAKRLQEWIVTHTQND